VRERESERETETKREKERDRERERERERENKREREREKEREREREFEREREKERERARVRERENLLIGKVANVYCPDFVSVRVRGVCVCVYCSSVTVPLRFRPFSLANTFKIVRPSARSFSCVCERQMERECVRVCE